MDPYKATAEIRFYPPRMSGREPRRWCIPSDEQLYREHLAPLPRERDLLFHGLPMIPDAAKRAAEMKLARAAIIDDPEEWEKIKPSPHCGGAI